MDLLTQGILWVDANTLQIIRMRSDPAISDLLSQASNSDSMSSQHKSDSGEVRLQDIPQPMWLPKEVGVYIDIGNQKILQHTPLHELQTLQGLDATAD